MPLFAKISRILTLLQHPRYVVSVFPTNALSVSSIDNICALYSYYRTLGTIIDVGANVGQFTLAAAYRYPNVPIHSFEPVPEAFRSLERNTKRLRDVCLNPFAVGNKSGLVEFHSNDYSQVSSVLEIDRANNQPNYSREANRKISVPMVTLDEHFRGISLDAPILLKMDVQGFEREVLWGAKEFLRRVEAVVFEMPLVKLYENQPMFDDLHSILKSTGFQIIAPVGMNRGLFNRVIEMDMLYARKDPREAY